MYLYIAPLSPPQSGPIKETNVSVGRTKKRAQMRRYPRTRYPELQKNYTNQCSYQCVRETATSRHNKCLLETPSNIIALWY